MKRPKKKAPRSKEVAPKRTIRKRSNTGQAQGQLGFNPFRFNYELLHLEGESYAEFIERYIRQFTEIPKGTGTFPGHFRGRVASYLAGRTSPNLSRKERP
jgi:hypothetical protein